MGLDPERYGAPKAPIIVSGRESYSAPLRIRPREASKIRLIEITLLCYIKATNEKITQVT